MKNFGYTINVNKDSNFIISHADADWSALKDNTLITIGNDVNFYHTGNKEEIFFIQDFINLNSKNISIQGNYEYLFLDEDTLTITYKEYELLTIKSVINKGNNYKVGDILSLSNGTPSVNISDNISQSTTLKVDEIDSNGGIIKLSILNKGLYISFPDKENNIKGGSGTNAKILVEGKLLDTRKTMERQIESVKESGHETILTLNYPINVAAQNGKISCKKWKVYLTSNYVGENQRNADYHVVHNISPRLGIPLLSKNSNKVEEYLNKGMLILEAKVLQLEQEIEKLKNR